MAKFTAGKRQKVLSKFGGLCFYCRKREAKTIDHWIPRSKGGKNNLGNLVPACSDCNGKKGDHKPIIDIETAWNSNLKPWEYEIRKVWNIEHKKIECKKSKSKKFSPITNHSAFRRIHPYRIKNLHDIY